MAINIKNPRTVALVREAAAATGKSQVGVVEVALAQYLEKVMAEQAAERARADKEVRKVRVARIRDEIRDLIGTPDPGFRDRMDAEMYDEAGLPR
jgi:hypothetical protein